MREGFALNGHAKRVRPGEIRLQCLTRKMGLREENFLVWTSQPPPLPDPALQGSELTWLVLARVKFLQFLKD